MSSNNRRIQRVPALLIAEEEDEMMKKKKNDYYPKVASIGPYHYGKPELAQVEAFKPVAVDLLVRSREEKDFFYQKVLAMIDQVRNCYEEESVAEYSDADLAQMMLRDASLIIAEMEIYLENGETSRKRKAEISRKRKAMIDHFGRLTGAVLFRDFILVENQIPLCVIQLLIELRHGADEEKKMINNYANKCIFGEIRPIVKSSRVPLHLLEFMHIILVYDCVKTKESSRGWYSRVAGIVFKVYDCVKTKESSRGSYSTGDIDMEVMASLPGSPQHATKTSNRSDEESSSGELGGASAAPNQTLTLGSRKHATETSNWSIDESTSSELGAPGDPNHTSTLGPRKPPTQTSNWSIEEGCSGKSGGAPEAPNHTLMVGSPTETSNRANQERYFTEDFRRMFANQIQLQFRIHNTGVTPAFATHTLNTESAQHATETSNNAKKVTHSFRKVMELKARGIHFRPSATQSLLDVKFESGFFYATLQLPEMFVSHYSKPFFKNLVAYELLPGVQTEPTVTSYINLMQSLVERPEDLEELRERKIVYNKLGSDEEALNVFKDINTHGTGNDDLFFEVRKEIQAHYNSRIKTWIAELIHTHFRSPWTFTAFLAAAAIIALTAAQLYYGVHPVADKTPTSS